MTPDRMAETVAEFQKLLAEGWGLYANLKAIYEDLEKIHEKVRADLADIDRMHGITNDEKTKKRAALTLVKNEPEDTAVGPPATANPR